MFQGTNPGEGKYKSILRFNSYDLNVLIYGIKTYSINVGYNEGKERGYK